MWSYWNLLDLGPVFDAVWMLRIVLPTRVRFSLLFSVLVYERCLIRYVRMSDSHPWKLF
jgi:hypothetical protein